MYIYMYYSLFFIAWYMYCGKVIYSMMTYPLVSTEWSCLNCWTEVLLTQSTFVIVL